MTDYPAWLDELIGEARQNEANFLARANACAGATEALNLVRQKLIDEAEAARKANAPGDCLASPPPGGAVPASLDDHGAPE